MLGSWYCAHEALALTVAEDSGVERMISSSSLHGNSLVIPSHGVHQPIHGIHRSWGEPKAAFASYKAEPYAETPTVVHDKEPGQGYEKGSPLYTKQEVLKHVLTEDQRRNLTHNPKLDGKFTPGGARGREGVQGAKPCSSDDTRDSMQLYHDFPMSMMFSNLLYLVLVIAVGIYYQRYLRYWSTLHTSTDEPPREDGQWNHSLFSPGSIRSDGHIYLTACCCPAVRWAATVSSQKTPMLQYWPALGLMIGIAVSMGFLLAPYYFVLACHFFGPDNGFLIVLTMVIFIGAVQSFAALMWFDMACWWLSTAFAVRGLTAVLGPWACFGIYLLMFISMVVGVVYRRKLRDAYGHERRSIINICLDILSWCCCPCCTISQEAKEVDRVLPKGSVTKPAAANSWMPWSGQKPEEEQRGASWGSEY